MEDQEFINQLAEKLRKLGTGRPLGFHYLHPYGTAPVDSIICNGATYSRALYKDFFDYITTQGWVKTEAEWQKIAKEQNGFCPFYSDGDGSTNFRTPKFAPHQQIAMSAAQATTYHQAGLPYATIMRTFGVRGVETREDAFEGSECFSWIRTSHSPILTVGIVVVQVQVILGLVLERQTKCMVTQLLFSPKLTHG